jgi:23S rRNA (adenine2503-C2)-methyltransferase
MSIPIFSCNSSTFVQKIDALLGKGKRHAALLYKQWVTEGTVQPQNWAEPQALGLIQEMVRRVDFHLPEVVSVQQEGETVKFLLRFSDGSLTESVVIQMQSGMTLCLSSQVGCKRGCAFCETGRMGLVRSLAVDEIVMQVFIAKFVLNVPVRSLVFMGMGEPFDNYENVMRAIGILTDPHGWGFGCSRITVSTSGCVPEMDRFTQEANPALNLAVSLHACNDGLRNRLMPINRSWDLEELKFAMQRYCRHPRREILIEYILIKGMNDTLEHADELVKFLQGLRVKINLIPYNAQRRGRLETSDEADQKAFLQRLRGHGFQALLRRHKGRGIMAACGQLNTREKMVGSL